MNPSNEVWAMESVALRHAWNTGLQPLQLSKGVMAAVFAGSTPRVAGYLADGPNAFIPIVGAIGKYEAGPDDECQMVSTLWVQSAIAAAMDDPSIISVVLYIDSPGGTVAGTSDLADFIFKAKALKPIIAYISDNCMSAAYWLASQCSGICANAGAYVGSIGVYQILLDSSEAAKAAGMTITLVADGEYKGLGAPGIPVDAKDISETQRRVSSATDLFVSAVALGRRFGNDVARSFATGQVWIASEALSMGLIDSIGTMEDAIAAKKPTPQPSPQPVAAMRALPATTPAKSKPNPAKAAVNAERDRMAAISAVLGDGTEGFAMRAWSAGLDAPQAKAAYDAAVEQEAAIARADARNPEKIWMSNKDNVRKRYRDNKAYFLADWNHTAKLKGAEDHRRIVKSLNTNT